jgi:hypothetical protein
MDALVFVGRGSVGTWDVYARDPKDLHLGTIREGKDNYLHVVAVRGTPLEGIPPGEHEDLEAAMAVIARHLRGTCTKWVP